MRAINGKVHLKKRKKILKIAKGFRGSRSKLYRIANSAVLKAGQHAYVSRKQRKSQMRSLWILRINAAARLNGLTYSTFMHQLKESSIDINRKSLADLAYHNADDFVALVQTLKETKSKAV